MSRSNRSNARAKESAGQRLASLYGKYFHTERVRTVSLRFSENPKRWSIEAVPFLMEENTPYPSVRHATCHVEITATLPPVWSRRRVEPRQSQSLISSTGYQIVAGTSQPLPPPPGEECTVRMVAFSLPVGESRYQLSPRWGFLFAGYGTQHLCGVTDQPPADTAKAIAAALGEFREHLAAKVAERLLPKPKRSPAIDKWAHSVRSGLYLKSTLVWGATTGSTPKNMGQITRNYP